ncbi:hypothetical protein PIB30_067829 [Stylosanthes scabra]|uniref:Uncharacterized protein n=1 Tax=Stylosanthes scabra TaxID=79078 RepID=A0ABU6UPE6_9FABA|nr:hypothetical protein [Stylosanthes scabra]
MELALTVLTVPELALETGRTWFLTWKTTTASTTFRTYVSGVEIAFPRTVISNSTPPSAYIAGLSGEDHNAKLKNNIIIEEVMISAIFLGIEVEEEEEMASPLPEVNTYTLSKYLFFTKDPKIHKDTSDADPFARMKLKYKNTIILIYYYLKLEVHSANFQEGVSSWERMAYGAVISSIPQQLSRFEFRMIN